MTGELPRIRRLNERQKNARALAKEAEAKALQADQAAAAGDADQARLLYDAAIELGRQALEAAPACEKDNLSGLGNLAGRKAALNKPAKKTPDKPGGGLPLDFVPGDISGGTGQVKVVQYFVFLLTNASHGLYVGSEENVKGTLSCRWEGGGIDCKPTDLVTYRKLLGPFATQEAAQLGLCGAITEERDFPLAVGRKGRWQGGSTWYGLWDAHTNGCPKKK